VLTMCKKAPEPVQLNVQPSNVQML
jgi:hypothetical protein